MQNTPDNFGVYDNWYIIYVNAATKMAKNNMVEINSCFEYEDG